MPFDDWELLDVEKEPLNKLWVEKGVGDSACSEQSHWEDCKVKKQGMPASTKGVAATNRPIFISGQGEKILSITQGECHYQGYCFLALRIPSWPTSDWLVPTNVKLSNLSLAEYVNHVLYRGGEGTHDFEEDLYKKNGPDKGWMHRSLRPLITHLFSSHGKLLDHLDLNSDPYNRSVGGCVEGRTLR